MNGGHDQMKNRCGFRYCEEVVEEFGGGSWRVRGGASPPPPPVDETLLGWKHTKQLSDMHIVCFI